jgi:hypothetical protein
MFHDRAWLGTGGSSSAQFGVCPSTTQLRFVLIGKALYTETNMNTFGESYFINSPFISLSLSILRFTLMNDAAIELI